MFLRKIFLALYTYAIRQSKKHQKATIAFALSIAVVIITQLFGLIALAKTPILIDHNGVDLTNQANIIKEVHLITLDQRYFNHIPLFFSKETEKNWWRNQKIMSTILSNQKQINVKLSDGEKEETVQVSTKRLSTVKAIKKLMLSYFVVFVYIGMAIYIIARHKNVYGRVLSYLFLACALFFASSSPMVYRGLVLHFPYFSILSLLLFISIMGMVTFAHYAMLFPKYKFSDRILDKIIPVMLYGGISALILSYFYGMISFGLGVIVIIVGMMIAIAFFVHSMIIERNQFLKKQLLFSIVIPLIVAAFPFTYNIFPDSLGSAQLRYTYFSLFSLMLPFAFTSMLGNIQFFSVFKQVLPSKRKFASKTSNNELEIGFKNTSFFIELFPVLMKFDETELRHQISSIKSSLANVNREIRYFLWVTSEKNINWEDYERQLRNYGKNISKSKNLEFKMTTNVDNMTSSPSLSLRIVLYYLFEQSLLNAVNGIGVFSVECHLAVTKTHAELEVSIHGKEPFLNQMVTRSKLTQLLNQIEKMKGEYVIETKEDKDTLIKTKLPLMN